MSDTQEPTMEEILASIRRIISEDDAPAVVEPEVEAAEAAPVSAASAPAPTPPPPAKVEPVEDDVLELTEPLEPAYSPPAAAAPPAALPQPAAAAPPPKPHLEETLGDLDVFSSRPAPEPAYAAAAPAPEEPLVGSYAAQSTAGHFGALARTVAMPKEGRTLEDVVRELLRPMLREWLDQNLPGIVEARVQAEVERISRRNDY